MTGQPHVDQPTLIEQMAIEPSIGVPEWPAAPWLAVLVTAVGAPAGAYIGRKRSGAPRRRERRD